MGDPGRYLSTTQDGESQVLADNISYLPFGPLKALTFGNGIPLTRDFDADYRLTDQSAGQVQDVGFARDPVGNITGITDGVDSTRSQSFGYDVLDRLISATGIYGTRSYAYDAVGNRTNTETDTYTIDSASNRLDAIAGTNPKGFSHDAAGNTVVSGALSFAYNQANRLAEASDTSGPLATNTYNGRGERVKKQAGGETTVYHYDQSGLLIAETDAAGDPGKEYVYLEGLPIAVLVATPTEAPAVLTSPTPGSTLNTATVSFAWSAGNGVTQYQLYVGTTPGAHDIHTGQGGTHLSETVSGIPLSGGTIHVRLWSLLNGSWVSEDFTYQAAGTPGAAQITTPTPGGTLDTATVVFVWSAGNGVTQYQLYVGTTPGAHDIHTGQGGTHLSEAVSGIPLAGGTIHVRLWSLLNGSWAYEDVTYQAAGIPDAAKISDPTPDATLDTEIVTFTWTPGNGVTQYQLYVGRAPGASDIHSGAVGTQLTETVSGIPLAGGTIHVRLWSLLNGSWAHEDVTYQAAGIPEAAQITSPTPGGTLDTATVVFVWSAGNGVTQYQLYVGTAAGAADIHNGQAGTHLSETVSGIPLSGSPVHVRLWSLLNGSWVHEDALYPTEGL
ncbi:MAG: hypothetical protein QNJ82_14875 [Gammaproteobacteria bacterium]|nr:hypothetical protein [Gammaproteobacteria bacterium]